MTLIEGVIVTPKPSFQGQLKSMGEEMDPVERLTEKNSLR